MDGQVTALSLFSGGLDSILASRVVAAQGIKVVGIKFISPFFDYQILWNKEEYCARMKRLYDVEVVVEDISESYLQLLHNPRHGFGKNFNPCVDCKVLMAGRVKMLLEQYGASFMISGEVLGQRPMSQRRDTLNVIERDSGTRDILLRPLSAKLMTPTKAERDGVVDRERLLDFSGRGRSCQIALAAEFGITEFPAPAGGCRLTDPILSRRVAMVYGGEFVIAPSAIAAEDMLCLMTGRQFVLPGGGWLCLGRDMKDNEMLLRLRKAGDVLLHTETHPGPTAILRSADLLYADESVKAEDIARAAALVVRYAKKVNGMCLPQMVVIHDGGEKKVKSVAPLSDSDFTDWML